MQNGQVGLSLVVSLSRGLGFRHVLFEYLVTILRRNRKTEGISERLDEFEGVGAKRSFAFKTMQNHSLEKIAEADFMKSGQSFQDFQNPPFYPYTSLYAFNL